jgi:hypothetical protein
MASSADPGDLGKPAAHKLSLEMRIALIGVLGALAGTLTGGLVTWVVTQDQLASQRADTRRAERLDAYSKYFGDAAQLWTQVFNIYEVTPRPTTLNASETVTIKTLEETLARDYALVVLLAPERVRKVARALNVADTHVGNALQSTPIRFGLYKQARDQAALGPNALLTQFSEAAEKDLGTPSR